MPNSDGSYNIKVAVAAFRKTTYISTKYNVDSVNQWKNGKVVKRPDAAVINSKLMKLLMAYEEILDENPSSELWEAKAVREYILKMSRNTGFIKDFAEEYIKRLEEDNRKSYASNMRYTLKYLMEYLGENMTLQGFTLATLRRWENALRKRGDSVTTINIRMSHLKALLNAAVAEGLVTYKIFPFVGYKAPAKVIRDLCLSREEFEKLRTMTFESRRMRVARDLFMLSFYCGGMNLTDMVDADWSGDAVSFVRKKTASRTSGGAKVALTLQPEAKEIIEHYVTPEGKLDPGYNYTNYGDFRSYISKLLKTIGESMNFEKPLMFYSARKTFCQFGFELGIPLYILEYAIGHTIKDAAHRPIFNYIKLMRPQADTAIRMILDTLKFKPEEEEDKRSDTPDMDRETEMTAEAG
ncbi:MAG: hypothetical protein HDS14_00360 [Bacteroides sp.]|nr:hypothetical protein [Bacteroides sp.]